VTAQSDKRLIEVAFPLRQTSLDSVHEKNVRHGHISTLHIWPARRPLAASRAALIATLLPDPGDPEKRKEILCRMAGTVVEKIERKKVSGKTVEVRKEETVGGILHWGRESGPELDWFRQEIRKAYGGRAPKVLDPFAGGGAIPLEAMHLGCEVTAVDINPVAWFILKCTLEYPQKLAGQMRPLPGFALRDRDFMESFLKAKGFKGALLRTYLQKLGLESGAEQIALEWGVARPSVAVARPSVAVARPSVAADDPTLQADLAWHVRAWGRWVLSKARKKLARYYPTYAYFKPLTPSLLLSPARGEGEKVPFPWMGEDKGGSETLRDNNGRPMRLVPLDEDGNPRVDELNQAFDEAYLKDPRNPRWIAKPTWPTSGPEPSRVSNAVQPYRFSRPDG
jgi:Adenine-specific DNA methylase containing a Zn-ribbon